MIQMILPKFVLLGSAIFIAVTEILNEVTETANKVGTLGMQGLLAFLLIVVMLVVWYQEKRRVADRKERDELLSQQYRTLLSHHDAFISKAETERKEFHTKSDDFNRTLVDLHNRSITAMQAMATSTNALSELIKDRKTKL